MTYKSKFPALDPMSDIDLIIMRKDMKDKTPVEDKDWIDEIDVILKHRVEERN